MVSLCDVFQSPFNDAQLLLEPKWAVFVCKYGSCLLLETINITSEKNRMMMKNMYVRACAIERISHFFAVICEIMIAFQITFETSARLRVQVTC